MPSVVDYTIGSGKTYATIQAWANFLDTKDLVGDDEQANGLLYDEVYDEQVTFTHSTGTSDATRYPVLKPAAGQQIFPRVEGSGPRMEVTQSPNVHFLDVGIDYLRIEDFEITRLSGTSSLTNPACIKVTSDNVTIRGMLLHAAPLGSVAGVGIISEPGPINIIDTFVYDTAGTAISCATFNSGTSYLYNNTVLGAGDQGIKAEVNAGATVEVKNNIALECVGLCIKYAGGGSGTIITDKNMSSDATADDNADGTHYISETSSSILVNITGGSEDLHLKTGTNAIDNGVDLGTTPAGVEVDIDGYDRDAGAVSWDVGADQQGLSGGGAGPTEPHPDLTRLRRNRHLHR